MRPVNAALPNFTVTRPRNAHQVVTKSKSPIRRHISHNPSSRTSKSPPRVNAVQVPVGTCLIYLTLRSLMEDMLPLEVTPRVNRVLVTKPHNKTPYELLHGRTPSIGFMRPFGCPMTILNTLDPLGKFQGKIDEGFLVGYSVCSKAFRVFNSRTSIIQETLHVNFLENKPNVAGKVRNTKPLVRPSLSALLTNPFSGFITPQQNGIAGRKNRTLIEAAKTMLAYSLLPIPFWAEAVNTACYVQNRVLVTKPHNKTPYELLHGRTPSIGFMRPFGCPMTILNTLDPLGKFQGKVDEGFLVGYSVCSKAFRVFNSRTSIIQETLHVNYLENKPNVAGTGPTWLFDIDSLTRTMN
nr:retrovirus-related Pol polyprotein from transposon TNT 1-94 [Tanacetum cinerariifolium]